MNIVIIGNGFDLAHGLPTSYNDFMDFLHNCGSLFSTKKLSPKKIDNRMLREKIIPTLSSDYKSNSPAFKHIKSVVQNNLWYKHFYKAKIQNQWIDFESEISRVVQAFDEKRLKNKFVTDRVQLSNENYILLQEFDVRKNISTNFPHTIAYNDLLAIRDGMVSHLNDFTLCFQIYLHRYVESLSVTPYMNWLSDISPNYLLSFNYTDTFSRAYNSISLLDTDYIHGKVSDSLSTEECNLIFGIDEYLSDSEKNEGYTACIQFKKYFQRIFKRTGCKYYQWIEKIKDNNERMKKLSQKNNAFIIGHSLDITDKDVLKSIINTENMVTTVFYHNAEAFSSQISNLVKVLGEDALISKVYGNKPSLYFVPLNQAKQHIELLKQKGQL